MSADFRGSESLDAMLDRVDAVFAEAPLETILSRVAGLCAEAAGIGTCAALMLDGREVSAEGWWPARDTVSPEMRAEVRREVRAWAATATSAASASGATPASGAAAISGAAAPESVAGSAAISGATAISGAAAPESVAGSAAAAAFLPLRLGPALHGVIVPLGGEGASLAPASVPAPVLRLVAARFAALQEAARASAARIQYERWFRTLDEQVRVLDRERQKFAAMVHQTDASVFVSDREGVVRWANAALSRTHPPEEGTSSWVSRECRHICARLRGDEGESACSNCVVRRAFGSGRVAHDELQRAGEHGTRQHYLTALPILGTDGKADEVMVMVQDLTGLDVVRRSESRYRVLFERSAKALVMVDPQTRAILLANPMASRLTGRSSEELLRLSLGDLHPPAEWERLRTRYASGFRDRNLDLGECQISAAGGAERIATVSGAAIDLDGQDAVMLELQDVTERREVEEELHRVEERLRAVVASAPIILFAFDRHGIFTLSEGRGLEALGRAGGDVVGKSAYEVYGKYPEIVAAIRRALQGEAFSTVVQIETLAFDVSFSPIREADGTVASVIGVATDVTQRHQLEERLRQAQKMEAIGRLAGGVAHDFNNLLAAIMGHAELALKQLDSRHPLRRHVEEVQKASVRGALLTRQLLSFSRREVAAPVVIDLAAVVHGMEALLRRLIGEDIHLETTACLGAVPVRADRGQLEQVVMNLAVNARDAMPRGGRLRITLERVVRDETFTRQHSGLQPGEFALLMVSDDGAGMDANTLARVFEPFFTTKPQGKGTGLGLSTAYAIVEQCGGHIGVTSRPAEGAKFAIHLPLTSETLARADSEDAPSAIPRGSESVLLVEDEPAVRALASSVLRSLGYAVIEACDGADAITRMQDRPGSVDLLVTDVVMPHMGGGELAMRMRSVQPLLRVLFMSGYTDDEVVRNGVLQQGAPFLQKPFSLDTFGRKVREVLDADPNVMLDPAPEVPGTDPARWRGPMPPPPERRAA